jgi:hypothetical protein
VVSALQGIGDAILDATQILLDDRSLARKVLVESAFGDRRFGRESLDAGGVDAVAVEQLRRGIQDALARATAALAGRLLAHRLEYTERFTSRVKWCSVSRG